MLNILTQIPNIMPSFLNSIDGLTIALANPVIGIIRPHLAKLTHLSKKPKQVKKHPKNINVIIINILASLVDKLKYHEYTSIKNKYKIRTNIEEEFLAYVTDILISAEEFGGSFGELIQSKDGMLWTTACSTENYIYEHTPELNKLVMIDPYTCEAIEIPTEHKVSVSWATWRHGMMQACEHSNKILWKDVCYFDWMMYEQVGAPQILYYDIETGEEGVFVDLTTINPDYSIYAGFSIDPETDNVYVPVASNSGYGPWFLLVFDPQGTLIGDPISIPIGDWSDYPSMTLFTDDYTPEFTLDDKYILDVNDKIEFNLADIVFDKDNTQNGIIVDILNVENPEIATAEIADNKLTLWMKGQGLTTITLKALSNGKSTTKTITLSESGTTGIESVGMFNSQLFYRNCSLNVINSAGSYVTIYNTSGNQLYKHQINSNNFSMPLNLSPGIYIATVNGNTLKIAIQ